VERKGRGREEKGEGRGEEGDEGGKGRDKTKQSFVSFAIAHYQ